MINVSDVQNELVRNADNVYTVLEQLGYDGIRDRGSYYQAYNLGGDNPTGFSIKKDTLMFNNWSHGIKGNIFTLVQDVCDCTFPQAIKKIADWIGFEVHDTIKNIKPPFGGFYKSIIKSESCNENELKTYPESILEKYNGLSKRFLNDGISLKVQEDFNIGFSHSDNAIAIPIRNIYSDIVGVKMRSNDDNAERRYWAEYPYQKSMIVYGLNKNYKDIVSKRTIIIGESEKFCMQLQSMGCYVGVGIGGHNISNEQARTIKGLMCDRIIVAFDRGISEDEIVYNCEKLKVDNSFMNNNVQYIYDKDGLYLNDKDSPSDHGLYVFRKMLKNSIFTIGS